MGCGWVVGGVGVVVVVVVASVFVVAVAVVFKSTVMHGKG